MKKDRHGYPQQIRKCLENMLVKKSGSEMRMRERHEEK